MHAEPLVLQWLSYRGVLIAVVFAIMNLVYINLMATDMELKILTTISFLYHLAFIPPDV